MSAYEFRFLNERGGTLLLYFTNCKGDEDARSRIDIACDLDYDRFEIWQEDRKIGSGRHLHAMT